MHDEVYEQVGLAPPRGMLLVGPSGTGKTAMARALSGEKQIPLIAIDGPQLYSKWLGESEKALREVFKKARRAAPCLLFFDTIDAVAPQVEPGQQGADVHHRILSQLLREIDNLRDVKGVILIGATNRRNRWSRRSCGAAGSTISFGSRSRTRPIARRLRGCAAGRSRSPLTSTSKRSPVAPRV
jgi:transitional endoplasmic reticulum ATPase